MNAKEFYEKVHGTGDDSENLNKNAIILLMEMYRIHSMYGGENNITEELPQSLKDSKEKGLETYNPELFKTTDI